MSLTIKPTSRLESLPTEVLHSICSYFCRHCRGDTLVTLENHPWTYETTSDGKITVVDAEPSQDLVALSRVSRRLRDVAQPVLYHEFPNFDNRERRLEPFLEAVTSRPDLAKAVKVVAWNSDFANDLHLFRAQKGYLQGLKVLGIDEEQVWRGRRDDRLHLKHHQALRTFIFGDKYNDTRSYDSLLWSAACSEILILLLALLPNLTTLIADDEGNKFLSLSALRVYGVNSIKLRELVATHLPQAILDVAPHLDELVLGKYNPREVPSGSSKRPGIIDYFMSKEDFNLEEAPPYRLDTRDLDKILTPRTQPLRRFRFETTHIRTSVDVPRPSFSYLHNFCTTLEYLHLDYDVLARLFGPTIRSLKEFTSLKEVIITANLIYTSLQEDDDLTRDANSLVDFLPDQIELFTVTDRTPPPFSYQTLARGFDGLLDAMIKGSFPKLRQARYELTRWQRVRQIYRQVGNVIEAEDSILRE